MPYLTINRVPPPPSRITQQIPPAPPRPPRIIPLPPPRPEGFLINNKTSTLRPPPPPSIKPIPEYEKELRKIQKTNTELGIKIVRLELEERNHQALQDGLKERLEAAQEKIKELTVICGRQAKEIEQLSWLKTIYIGLKPTIDEVAQYRELTK